MKMLAPGDVLDGFAVQALVHSGGMAHIYRVHYADGRPDPGFVMAMKVPRMAGGDGAENLVGFEVEQQLLQALTGEQISVRLRQEDGSYRAWHAYVVGSCQAGSDGGLARYRLSCRSWLHSLGARLNTHVYQDKTALQIVEASDGETRVAS